MVQPPVDRRSSPLFRATAAVVSIVGLWAGLSLGQWRGDATEVVDDGLELRTEVQPAVLTPSTTTTTIAPTTTTEPPLRTATLAFTGDTLAHRGLVRQAREYAAEAGDVDAEYDFGPMFELVQPYISAADLAICHLETPLSPDNTGLSGYPTFNVPRELADALAGAGFDGCSTASNHSLDRRSDGVFGTLDVLDEAGLKHSGMARSAEEAADPTLYEVAGITVANLSYSYGFNGFELPADQPWLANQIDPDAIIVDARTARDAGAEYVVVSLHWGTEYRHEPNEEQLAVAEVLTARPEIDLIIGHHAHVVQPIEEVNGTPVVFGLGNFISNQSANCCVAASQDGAIVEVEIAEVTRATDDESADFETSISVVETWVDRSDFTVVPVSEALEDPELVKADPSILETSLERTRSVMKETG